MKTRYKIVIFLLIIIVITVGFFLKRGRNFLGESPPIAHSETPTPSNSSLPFSIGKGIPVIVDLGAGHCIPCKEMKPILEGLSKELKGKVLVHIVDLNIEPQYGDVFKVRLIPTQIFFNPSGDVVFRHEGLMKREDILKKLKELDLI